MNDNFTDQKEKLVAISHEISLLRQQVNYLLRNGKPLGLLDLDVLMNRTHAIYDQLCAINAGDEADEPDFDFNPEALAALFGATEEETPTAESETVEPAPVEPVETAPVETVQPTAFEPLAVEPVETPPVVMEQPEPAPVEPIETASIEKPQPIAFEPVAVEPIETAPVEAARPEPFGPVAVEPVETAPVVMEQPEPVEKPFGDDYGFIFRFEDIPPTEAEATPADEPADAQPPVVVDGKTVHFVEEVPENEIPERDRVVADELLKDTLFEMPPMEDMGFEMAGGETLGETFMREDHSIAAKLQQSPVKDLRSSIGINDKFLFVNELFGGSMEKYNKSIDNLNDLKTLNGAMIYLNELKIELQWNGSNEAYQKLAELVKRKFE